MACSSPEPVFAGLPGAGCGGGESRAAAESGAALATYTVFMDMSLGITGPLAGLVMARAGVPVIYLAAAGLVVMALMLTWRLKWPPVQAPEATSSS